ncbi:hypothetical protein AYI68_g6037 [Smittium mucronatum]|uniref:Uncharacterized protein n=1 Tax=Smittium mucronatum TaxID=133383 RepID=A0A1R0GSL1_9FUNG|nr:hypothetical protein AYI68_g6037 [Smittium mucronatum]
MISKQVILFALTSGLFLDLVFGTGYGGYKQMDVYNYLKASGLDLEALDNLGFVSSPDNNDIASLLEPLGNDD